MNRLRAAIGAMVLLAAAPAAAQVKHGEVVWHDLVTSDLEVSKAFYGELFGWTWRAPSSGKGVNYIVAEMDGRAMAGLAQGDDDKVSGSQWITYFAAHGVETSARTAVDSGAKLVAGPMHTGSWNDESALLIDPQGAPFALMKPGFTPAQGDAPINGWLWVELWTTDVAPAAAFYGHLLGLQSRNVSVGGQSYTLLQQDTTPRAGVLAIPVKGVRPNWLPTIRVADLDEMVKQAVALGGRVILAPRADMRDGTVAIIADPTGAALTLQEWNGIPEGVGAR